MIQFRGGNEGGVPIRILGVGEKENRITIANKRKSTPKKKSIAKVGGVGGKVVKGEGTERREGIAIRMMTVKKAKAMILILMSIEGERGSVLHDQNGVQEEEEEDGVGNLKQKVKALIQKKRRVLVMQRAKQ